MAAATHAPNTYATITDIHHEACQNRVRLRYLPALSATPSLMSNSVRPRKRFGQHFLRDNTVLQGIVAAISPKEEDNIVEIGPGEGVLTKLLLPRNPALKIVEIDRDLAKRLESWKDKYPELSLYNVDALRFDFGALADDENSLRVVGNLPYNISTPLIFHLLENAVKVRDMHFLLQKEVVQRLASAPGDKNYGRLSVMTQYYCEAEYLFDVGPEAFYPPPKVDSAVVRLTVRKQPPAVSTDFDHFASIVKQAFMQRRKTLRKSLQTVATPEQIEQSGLSQTIRPEQISVEEFIHLSNTIIETS